MNDETTMQETEELGTDELGTDELGTEALGTLENLPLIHGRRYGHGVVSDGVIFRGLRRTGPTGAEITRFTPSAWGTTSTTRSVCPTSSSRGT